MNNSTINKQTEFDILSSTSGIASHSTLQSNPKELSLEILTASTNSSVPAAPPEAGRIEIVFIENNVRDIDALLQGIGNGREVHILDSNKDGLKQMADILIGRKDVDALHLISHGKEASVNLGGLILDQSNINEHAAELKTIGDALSKDGDILLYGCDIGANQGKAFIDQLAVITGADIAASNDLTGGKPFNANWDLEVNSGSVQASSVGNPQLAALYHNVLNIASATLNFDTAANFNAPGNPGGTASGANDVIYQVNGNSAYLFKIDGAVKDISRDPSGYITTDFYDGGTETSITFSFQTGQQFDATSIVLTTQSLSQDLVFKGYNASNTLVATNNKTIAGAQGTQTILNFSGMTGVTKIVMTATTNGNKVRYAGFDDIVLANIQPPAPKVTSVSSAHADGSFTVGEVIAITVTFDQNVDVVGTPQLTLETGTTDRTINFATGSGTKILTFNYTVQAGDTAADLDYISSGALTLNSGTIKIAGGATNADLTLPLPNTAGSLRANKNIVIDTTAPSTPSAPNMTSGTDNGASNADDLTNDTTPTFTGTAEPGSTVTLYDTDGTTVVGTGTATGGSYSITTTPLSAGSHTITAKATDAAGNTGVASGGLTVTIDTTSPAVSSVGVPANGTYKLGQALDFTVNFGESVHLTGTPYIPITLSTGGTVNASYFSGDGTSAIVFRYTIASGNLDADGVVVGASINLNGGTLKDTAGNDATLTLNSVGTTTNVLVDGVIPTVSSINRVSAANTNATSVQYTVTFSESVTGVDTSDFALTTTSSVAGTIASVSGSGTTYTVTVNSITGDGTMRLDLNSSSTGIADTATNAIATGYTSGQLYTIDTTAPIAPSIPDMTPGTDNGNSQTDDLTNNTTPTFTGTAEAGSTVTLYDTDGVTVLGSGIATGGNYSIATTTLSPGSHTITAKATDTAGNTGAASAGLSITVDTTAPSLASAITISDTALKIGETATVTFTFDEAVTGFTTADVTVPNGALSNLTSGDGGITWTATLTPNANATAASNVLTLDYTGLTDLAGNAGTGSATSGNYAVDTARPVLASAITISASLTLHLKSVTLRPSHLPLPKRCRALPSPMSLYPMASCLT